MEPIAPETIGTAEVGIIGMGTMGANLALNLLDKGFTVAVFNRSTNVATDFLAKNRPTYGASKVLAGKTYEDFASLLRKPRKAMILVVAGKVTDMVIEDLARVFEQGDIIVDTGNAHFKDQTTRAEMLEARGLRFLGMGVSGGAEGARKGPAFFPGGTLSVWEDIKPIVEAASAKAKDGRPCVTMCGSGGAGSCVKMYHNAGEYAILQIWGEAYAVLRNQIGLPPAEIQKVLGDWKARGALDSYMLDITHAVCGQKDDKVPSDFMVDRTADMIGSKGTGLWSVQEAMSVGVPCPSLAQAVIARQMSMCREERQVNAAQLPGASSPSTTAADKAAEIEDLYHATNVSIIASYAQMFQCIRGIDKEFKLEIIGHLPRIISTFRAGCILQGAMLEPMTKAFEENPNISNLMCAFQKEIADGMPGFRRTMAKVAMGGECVGVMFASLTYVTTMAQPTMLAGQVVALQRDVFGRHGFKRLKEDGTATEESYSAEWSEMIP